MTPLQQYIAEEIATDHVEGLLSRREAFRRLGLLGVGAAAASALIASFGSGRAVADPSTEPPTPAPVTDAPGLAGAVPTQPITWAGPAGELQGAWAAAAAPRGAVLVIHENKGLNDYIRSVAGRLAGVGYSALAIDLLSAKGGTGAFADPAEATGALGQLDPDAMVVDLKSGVTEVANRAPGLKLGVVGFCFGGGLVWRLLDSVEPQLAAAVPFYGPLPDDPDFAGNTAAVLGFYGELDTRVTSAEPLAKAALDRAGLVNELVVEPGADHAFFNDTGERYQAAAANDAWVRLQDWFGRYLV